MNKTIFRWGTCTLYFVAFVGVVSIRGSSTYSCQRQQQLFFKFHGCGFVVSFVTAIESYSECI